MTWEGNGDLLFNILPKFLKIKFVIFTEEKLGSISQYRLTGNQTPFMFKVFFKWSTNGSFLTWEAISSQTSYLQSSAAKFVKWVWEPISKVMLIMNSGDVSMKHSSECSTSNFFSNILNWFGFLIKNLLDNVLYDIHHHSEHELLCCSSFQRELNEAQGTWSLTGTLSLWNLSTIIRRDPVSLSDCRTYFLIWSEHRNIDRRKTSWFSDWSWKKTFCWSILSISSSCLHVSKPYKHLHAIVKWPSTHNKSFFDQHFRAFSSYL